MTRYTIYTAAVSYKPEFKPKPVFGLGGETPVYRRNVNADSRLEALEKCLPDLRKELPKINCKYLAVFVGKTHYPSAYPGRLMPFQLDAATGELRQK